MWNLNMSLTLIHAAGGEYDFQNFEQVKLRSALSNEHFKIDVFLKKHLVSISC
jgi:hypothetical protein